MFFYRATKVKLSSDIPPIETPKINDAISLKEFKTDIEPKNSKNSKKDFKLNWIAPLQLICLQVLTAQA